MRLFLQKKNFYVEERIWRSWRGILLDSLERFADAELRRVEKTRCWFSFLFLPFSLSSSLFLSFPFFSFLCFKSKKKGRGARRERREERAFFFKSRTVCSKALSFLLWLYVAFRVFHFFA